MKKIILTILLIVLLTTPLYSHALYFKGNSGFVSVGNVLDVGSGDFSVSLWLRKTTTTGLTEVVVGKSAADGGTLSATGWRVTTNVASGIYSIRIAAHDGTDSDVFVYTPTPSVINGRWNHVVFTWKKGESPIMYWNGVLEPCSSSCTPSSFPNIDSLSNANDFTIGARDGGTGLRYIGDIADVRMYNRVLSPLEAKAIMYGYNTYNGLMARFLLDGNALPFIPDISGKGINGRGLGSAGIPVKSALPNY